MVILKSSNSTNKTLNVLILSWHQFEHFLPLLKFLLFFNTGNLQADGNPQVSPDVGTSPYASNTGFEELMDVSDGKGISHLGLFWEIIRSGLYHLIIYLTSILYHQYAYSPYCSL